MNMPRLVAFCGHPGSGKTTAQEILKTFHRYHPIDDGYPLRDFAVRHLGLTWDDVQTPEGKLRTSDVAGFTWQNRKILGELGKAIDAALGPDVIPFMATRGLLPHVRYTFGSVRREQARVYKAAGAVVVGIRNPDAMPSPHDFDRFDENLVDIWIANDAPSRGYPAEVAKRLFGIALVEALNAFAKRVAVV